MFRQIPHVIFLFGAQEKPHPFAGWGKDYLYLVVARKRIASIPEKSGPSVGAILAASAYQAERASIKIARHILGRPQHRPQHRPSWLSFLKLFTNRPFHRVAPVLPSLNLQRYSGARISSVTAATNVNVPLISKAAGTPSAPINHPISKCPSGAEPIPRIHTPTRAASLLIGDGQLDQRLLQNIERGRAESDQEQDTRR